MAYLTAADMRADTLAEYAWGLSIDPHDVPLDATITAAITRQSQRFDNLTNDHYAAETLTLNLDGSGTDTLFLPRRCTAVSAVSIINDAGTVTAQASGSYRLHSSLDTTGATREGDFDYLSMIQWGTGITGLPAGWIDIYRWPAARGAVRVAGTFGWTTTPPDVKRAVALLVYDQFAPQADVLNQAQSWSDAGTNYTAGMTEFDGIVNNYRRELLMVG